MKWKSSDNTALLQVLFTAVSLFFVFEDVEERDGIQRRSTRGGENMRRSSKSTENTVFGRKKCQKNSTNQKNGKVAR